ncbi:MAG TPA: hypothetical protein PKZ75_13845 [Bacteroidia bacterium]|nr:hypothetical protein [Bacteroidia bacterium]
MFRRLLLSLIFFYLKLGLLSQNQHPVFEDQSFGKGSSSYYIGSGAFKRHFDLNRIDYGLKEFAKSPAIVLGADFCIYPHASNAYLGLGPYFTGWVGVKETEENNQKIERLFSNTTFAVKFTHHATYFVRKKLDVCSGYIAGLNLKYYHSYKVNGEELASPQKNNEIVPALGITLAIKYYVFKNTGFYIEGGIGYRVNMLNIGLCYKFKKQN